LRFLLAFYPVLLPYYLQLLGFDSLFYLFAIIKYYNNTLQTPKVFLFLNNRSIWEKIGYDSTLSTTYCGQ